MNPQGVYSLAVQLQCTNRFLTKPVISSRGKLHCQYSGWCKHNINIYTKWLIDGDCMENSLQRWTTGAVNIQSKCISSMMWTVGGWGGFRNFSHARHQRWKSDQLTVIHKAIFHPENNLCSRRLDKTNKNDKLKLYMQHEVCVRVCFAVQQCWFPAL